MDGDYDKAKKDPKHSMQEYEVQNLLASLQRQGHEKAYAKVKALITELKSKKAIKEENSIKINILKKKLSDEPKKLEVQKQKLVKMIRKSNQAKIDQLKEQLVHTQNQIEQISFDEENGRAMNNLLIIENQKKQKLQESLVQLLNDTMAEKARMQINVNKTKMETNSCNEAKIIRATEFKDYKNKHDLNVEEIQDNTKMTKKSIKKANNDIRETTNKVEKAYNKSLELQKTCQVMDTNNHTAKIQLSEHNRRIGELTRQKTFSEKQICEKRDVRNAKLTEELDRLKNVLKAVTDDYSKKIGIAIDKLKDCQECLVRNQVENDNLIELKAEWERSLACKREELDEVVNFMSGVRETTENIRIQLDKKRRAIMRVRNENDGIAAELNRATSSHKQEVMMIEQLINDLIVEVDASTKVKMDLEKDFKKLQKILHGTRMSHNEELDQLERRNKRSTVFSRSNTKDYQEKSEELHVIEEDFDDTCVRYTARRNAVVHDTETNKKLIEEFGKKIIKFKSDIIDCAGEQETLTGPYTILKKEHFDEEYRYNKLKSNVLELNQQLRNCNQTITDDNKEIDDMQAPRNNARESLTKRRAFFEAKTTEDRLAIYRVERHTYEIQRKLEEYQNRSNEIFKNCELLLKMTANSSKLVKIIDENKHAKDDQSKQFLEDIKKLNNIRDQTFQQIYDCGDGYARGLERFNDQLEKRFMKLEVIEGEIEESCQGIRF